MGVKTIELTESYIVPKAPINVEKLAENLKQNEMVIRSNVWTVLDTNEVHVVTNLVIGDTILDGGINVGLFSFRENILSTADFKERKSFSFKIEPMQGLKEYVKYIYMILGYLSEKHKVELPESFHLETNSKDLVQAFEELHDIKADSTVSNIGKVKFSYQV